MRFEERYQEDVKLSQFLLKPSFRSEDVRLLAEPSVSPSSNLNLNFDECAIALEWCAIV